MPSDVRPQQRLLRHVEQWPGPELRKGPELIQLPVQWEPAQGLWFLHRVGMQPHQITASRRRLLALELTGLH